MKRLVVVTMALAVLGCADPEPSAQEKPQIPEPDYAAVQSMIEAEIKKNLDATIHQDIDAYMDLIPEDFLIYDESGEVVSREQQRTYILRDWSIIDTTLAISMVVDSMKHLSKDSVWVYTSQDWERLMFQRDGVTTDTVRTTQVHLETWRMTPKGWMVYDVVELGGKIFINGETYEPN